MRAAKKGALRAAMTNGSGDDSGGVLHRGWLCLALLMLLSLGDPTGLHAAPVEREVPRPLLSPAKLETQTLAILVGSGVYHGTDQMPPLQFADDDVLRFARMLQPLVQAEDLQLLFEPDAEVAAQARALGLSSWRAPQRDQLLIAFSRVEQRTRQLRLERPGVKIQVLFFVSAHGDTFGVHLADTLLTGGELQEQLHRLTADGVVLVADSCFSDAWLGLKSGSRPQGVALAPLPLDAMADAVRNLERVGAVTAQSYTREERTLIRGGLVTHVLASALLGPADLDEDGRILYDELAAWLRTYGRSAGFADSIKVRQPRKPVQQPAAVVDLRALTPRGLELSRSAGSTTECFWIRRPGGALLAETCKAPAERRRLYLPAGSYWVQWRPLGSAWGREQVLTVSRGFVPLQGDQLSGYWISGLFKGEKLASSPPRQARMLSEEESAYLSSTPFQTEVDWRALPGRESTGLRLSGQLPLTVLSGAEVLEGAAVSLTQERPALLLQGVREWRIGAQRGGFVLVGGLLGLGLSGGNTLEAQGGLTLLPIQYGLRLGWERRLEGLRLATSFNLGGLGYGVPGYAELPQGLARAGWSGLELSLAHTQGRGRWLELGVMPSLVVEPRRVGMEQQLLLAPYLSLQTFVGSRF
ncbi:MAG: hypothetical protein ACKO6N_28360 [Myxococcota bacterium]